MAEATPNRAALEQRVARLERQNRRLKQAGAAALILAGVVVLTGGQRGAQDRPAGPEQWAVRDGQGTERAVLGMTADGPALRLRDAGGKDRLWLGVVKDVPGLVLYDAQGRRRASLSSGPRALRLTIYDDARQRQAWLVMSPTSLGLHLTGTKEARHAGLCIEGDGVTAWHHDPSGRIHVGADGLKSVPSPCVTDAPDPFAAGP